MKLFIALLIALVVALSSALKELPERARGGLAYKQLYGNSPLTAKSDAQFWAAKVDNFDIFSNSTFQQRYYVDNQYWDGKGPVFFEIGGEGTLNGPPAGYIGTLAKKYNALIVALEHRFYGVSIPNGNVNTANLRFLAVEQALADLAGFTDFFKKSYGTNDASWFVFVGSYPGALSSWYRKAYPDHSVGSLSSSGVVNCIVDYDGFDKQVSAAIGNECSDQIRRINAAFEEANKTPAGWNQSLNMFNCEADMWRQDFYYMIADSWSMADQYSAKSQLCDAILKADDKINAFTATARFSSEEEKARYSDQQLMQAFADFSNSFWGPDFCAGGFYNTEQLANPKRWETNSRSWRWQTCYQVSYFNTAPKSGSLRSTSVDLNYHLEQCARAFGIPMYPASANINAKFGADTPTAHNVFYSDFSDDPWLRASVDYPASSDQPFFRTQCDNCGHCMDFHAPTENDPAALKQSRAEFEKYLEKWLNDAKPK